MGPVLGGQQWDLPGGIPPQTQQAAHNPRGQAQEEPGSGTPGSGGSRVEAAVWEVSWLGLTPVLSSTGLTP